MRRAAEVTITIPSTRWHTDAPAARITTALVARDGQVSDGSADSLRQARAAGQPLGLVVDRDLPAAALATLLVGVGTPTSQRVYVLTTVYGGPTWRALFLAPDALPEGADVVEVDGGAITRGQAQRIESSDPETLARLIDGELSTPVHLAAREGTTVGQLLVAIDAADVRNRRAVWMLGAPRRSTP